MTRFKTLEVAGWRQFGSVQIEFHPRATIITGANGSGKTTLLSILSQHFGWSPTFIGTPRIDRRGALEGTSPECINDVAGKGNADVGKLTYDDGAVAALQAPMEGASFQIAIQCDHRQCPASTSPRTVQSTVLSKAVTEIPTRR